MADPVFSDRWAIYSLDNSSYLRLTEDFELIGALGELDLGTTALEIGSVYIADDEGLYFGNDQDSKMEYDENGTNQLRVTGAEWLFVDASIKFSDAAGITLGTGGDDLISHNGTVSKWTHNNGNLDFDNTAVTGATYFTLGTDTSATEWAVRDNSEARHFIITGAGVITLGGATGNAINVGGRLVNGNSGTGTGLVVEQHGTSVTEGWQEVIYEDTISPAAIETALLTIPAGSIVDGVWANVETALTGGGTTTTWSIGITGDVDSFGTATTDDYTTQGDDLTQDSKWTYLGGVTPLSNAGASIGLFDAAAVALKLIAAATGGATAGDTALTLGTVRIRVKYRTALPMDNA